MGKISKKILLGILVFLLLFIGYFFIGTPPQAKEITWGVNFSQKHAQNLGLDWRETYLAILEDLGARNLKIITYWDLIEPRDDEYNFNDLDWQIKEAEKREAKILLVIGLKTPRWPECHEPSWVQNQKSNIKNQKLLEYIEKVVNKYKDSKAIWAWQVENEPFFPFGECPKIDEKSLQEEIDLVKFLDTQNRPIIISDSGELSFWFKAGKLGDIVGTSLYQKIWSRELKIYISYPFPPVYYWRKAQIVKKLFGKPVICVELQAEPWGQVLLYDLSLEEQRKTMNLEQFKENIEFAKATGLNEFYLWGAEWWYWLKTKQNNSQIWNETKELLQ